MRIHARRVNETDAVAYRHHFRSDGKTSLSLRDSTRSSSSSTTAPSFSANSGHCFAQIPVNPPTPVVGTLSPDDLNPPVGDLEGGIVVGANSPENADHKTNNDPVAQGGETETTKQGCPHHFEVRTSAPAELNTETSARGRSDVTFQADASGNGKQCDCSCPVYRQFIKGFIRLDSPTGPKQHEVIACRTTLTINESTFTEEPTGCIGDNDADPCKWAFADGPGPGAGLFDGRFAQVHFTFRFQIWDACRDRSLAMTTRTLDIIGSKAPRTIKWSS